MSLMNKPFKPAERIHMDVVTGILRDSDNRGVIVIAFGESGYEVTVAAASHEEAGPLATVAGVLKDTLKNADAALEATLDMTDASPTRLRDREVNPHEGGGTGVVGTSG